MCWGFQEVGMREQAIVVAAMLLMTPLGAKAADLVAGTGRH